MTSASGADAVPRVQALQALDRLPPFSPILNKLLAMLAHEDVSFAELADLIEKDTVLTGNVLRLVNSALYGFEGTVNSVRHAVAILGLMKLRNVLLGMSVARIWRNVAVPPGWSAAAFNLHSVATGILADLVVQAAPAPYPEGAFVAGLLHDIGKLLIAIALPDEHEAIQRMLRAGGRMIEECELEIIGTTHAELSGEVLAKWNLPAPIQEAVLFHHAPDRADEGRLHLSHVIQAADGLAAELGYPMPSAQDQAQRASAILENPEVAEQLPRLLEQFQLEFEIIRSFF